MRNAKQIISFYTVARDRRNIVERKIRFLRSVAIWQTAIRFFSAQSFSAPAVEKIPLRFIISATHVSNFVVSVF